MWDVYLTQDFTPTELEEASSLPHLAYQELALRRKTATLALLWRNNFLRLYNCITRTLQTTLIYLPDFEEFGRNGALLSPSKLFLCGGTKDSRSAGLTDLKTARKTLFPPLKIARNDAGVVFLRYSLYVFGGFDKVSLSSAERFDLITHMWTALPDMISPRSSFSVCYRGRKVYLCGGNTQNCEIFDTFSEIYEPIPIQLYIPDSTMAVLDKEMLFICDSDCIYRYKGGNLQYFQVILQWGV